MASLQSVAGAGPCYHPHAATGSTPPPQLANYALNYGAYGEQDFTATYTGSSEEALLYQTSNWELEQELSDN